MSHVLIVEDDANSRAALAEIIAAEGFTVALAADLREARIQMVRHLPDVLLTDLRLPDGSGLELFKSIMPGNGVEVILITGHATVETAVDALRQGATDYLVKPVNMQRLRTILSRVPRSPDLKAEIGNLRGELRRFGLFGQMLGSASAMQELYDQINRVAPTEATVLLTGESGTGKELAAQTLHALSLRRKQPFLPVNCGAISPTLIESEVFGHEKGSFTGADRQHKGYFERAHGGTLFLDEITEMPIELQVKLLRVLETGVFMRVGTNREIEADVRIVAATNRDPEVAVMRGRLRPDLYHRLNVFPIRMPPLRIRGKDIEMLAQSFLDQLNATHSTGKVFAPGFLAGMEGYAWPGNVRELKNFIHRAFILTDGNVVQVAAPGLRMAPGRLDAAPPVSVPMGSSLADADRRFILATLEHCGGVRRRTADMLNVSLKTLYNRLEEYGVMSGEKESS